MKKTILSLLFMSFMAMSFSAQAITFPQENPHDFEVSSYLGKWYDFARTPNPFQDNTPERDGVEYSACFDSSAEYALASKKSVSVLNTCYRRGANGDLDMEDIEGRASIVKGSNGTRLRVAFGGFIARFFQRVFTFWKANYWIYALGDKNEEGLYSWSLVSGKKKDFIFVLTRELRVEPEVKAEIIETAKKLGLPVEKLIFNDDR